MNFQEKHIELFRSYLDGTLSAEAKKSFEKRISEDENFQETFNEFKAFESSLRGVETVEVYDLTGKWEKELQSQKKKGVIRKLWVSSIGVAAAATIAIFLWMPETPSNQQLAAASFQPYENVITVRGKKELLDRALNAYDEKRYEKALELFNQYPNDSIGMFYRAETLMALERYDDAANVFEEVVAQNGIFVEVAQYHHAIALLGAGKTTKAVSALKSIPRKNHYYNQAKDLLERL